MKSTLRYQLAEEDAQDEIDEYVNCRFAHELVAAESGCKGLQTQQAMRIRVGRVRGNSD